jgi:integrase
VVTGSGGAGAQFAELRGGTAMARITKRVVDALKPGAFAWDRGFGVKATATGAKVYVLSYRIGRRKRRYTIGLHGHPWTPDAARKEASRLLALIGTGVDPMAVKAATREAPTVRELAERFLAEHADVRLKPRTAQLYRRILEGTVAPAFGSYRVGDVTRADVAALMHRLRRTPGAANNVRIALSKLFNMAERWGLRPDGSNPVRHVERFRAQPRHRYLSGEEFRRLGEVLTAAEAGPVDVPGEPEPVRLSPTALAAIRLLIYTGARRGEILTLRWADVDIERGELRLPTSKTGFKVIHLNAPALAVLTRLPSIDENPHVLPGVRRNKPLVNVTATWHVVRALAGLKDVRLHDLRHTHASVGAGAGLSLHLIGGLLGHTQPGTTARYAHLASDPLKQAAELVGARIVEAMTRANSPGS